MKQNLKIQTVFFIITAMLLFIIQSCGEAVNPNQTDRIIVIGGGLMGSATAWELSQRGYEVLLLEKQDSIYTEGSSFGEARIARSNNRGNDIWSYLHNTSVDLTNDLIDFLNEVDGSASYKMEDIYNTSPVTYVGTSRIYDQIMASVKRQKIDSKIALGPEEGREMFDISLIDDILLQQEYRKHSGTINPHQLITYLHQGIKKHGNEIRYQSQVEELNYDSQSELYEIEVNSNGTEEILKASKVISAAGPYNGPLLKNVAPYFDSLINPERVFLAFLKIDPEVYESLNEAQKEKIENFYPVINSSRGTRETSFFSMVEYYDENDHPIIKIGGHFQRSAIDNLDEIWKKELSEEEIDWSVTSTHYYFDMLEIPVEREDFILYDGYSCVYSLTSNEIPYITPIITKEEKANTDVIVLGGLSGVGAKGAMSYGMIAANMMDGETKSDSLYQVIEREMGFERLKKDVLK